jgi:hypothetical protein
VQFAGGTGAADESIGPSACEKRRPQDDKLLWGAYTVVILALDNYSPLMAARLACGRCMTYTEVSIT